MKKPFSKPAFTISEQIKFLQNKGMIFAGIEASEEILASVGYYHLSAYWFPYKTSRGDFHPNTNFSEIIKLYEFDRTLKMLIAAALERIEISVRAHLIDSISLKYGPHGWLDWQIYKDCAAPVKLIRDTINALAHPNDQFIEHYARTYTPPLPPLWIAAELFSFGSISKILKSLTCPRDRKNIAQNYGLFEKPFLTAIHHLVYIRNICTHHGRLWNRDLRFPLALPQSQKSADLEKSLNAGNYKIYNTLCYINYLLRHIRPQTNWKQDIIRLIETCPAYALPQSIGFPADWRRKPLWQ